MSALSYVYNILSENMSQYSNIESVMGRLEKNGWIEQIVEMFAEIKYEEERHTKRELKKIQKSRGPSSGFDLEEQLILNSKIFQANFSLITTNIVNSIWSDSNPNNHVSNADSKSSLSKSSDRGTLDGLESSLTTHKNRTHVQEFKVAGSFKKEKTAHVSEELSSKEHSLYKSKQTHPAQGTHTQHQKHSNINIKESEVLSGKEMSKPVSSRDTGLKSSANTNSRRDRPDTVSKPLQKQSHLPKAAVFVEPLPQSLPVRPMSSLQANERKGQDNHKGPTTIYQQSKQASNRQKPTQNSQQDVHQRLSSPRQTKNVDEMKFTANSIHTDKRKVVRGSKSLERQVSENESVKENSNGEENEKGGDFEDREENPRDPPIETGRSGQRGKAVEGIKVESYSREEARSLGRSPRKDTSADRRSQPSEEEVRKAEEEFNRRLIISVKKKLLGATPPLDVS